MKYVRLITLLFCILFLLISMAGCQKSEQTYTFAQSIDDVKSIEICRYDYEAKCVTSLKSLTNEEMNALWRDIPALTCKQHFGDHTMDYGEIVIYITYKNGESEVIGIWNVALVDSDGEWHIGGVYFDKTEFSEMLLKYIDAESVPELK